MIPFFWKFSINVASKIGYQDSEIVVSIIFMMIVSTLSTLISIPFQIYSNFVIEERYGFNKLVCSTSRNLETSSSYHFNALCNFYFRRLCSISKIPSNHTFWCKYSSLYLLLRSYTLLKQVVNISSSTYGCSPCSSPYFS